MQPLYKITNEYQRLLSDLIDEETGEVDQNSVMLLDNLLVEAEDKAIAVASYIKNLGAEVNAIRQAKREMQERELAIENKQEWLINYLQSNMERLGITEVKCPYFAIKLKKCPISTDIQDEDLIPDEYKKKKEVVSVDKLKIKEDLQAGIDVPGAALKTNMRLEIR